MYYWNIKSTLFVITNDCRCWQCFPEFWTQRIKDNFAVPEEEHLKNILPCQRIKQSTAELKEPTIEQQQERRKEYNYNYKCGGEVATNKPHPPPPKAPTTDPNTKTIIIPLRLPQQLKPTELPYLKWASERTIIMKEWAGGWWEGGWQENAEGVLIIIIMGFPRTTKPSRTTSETAKP